MTISQRKAKINGFIKTYEERIEQYKLKHGHESFRYKLLRQSCKNKIESWRKELKTLGTKVNKVPLIEDVTKESEKYFGYSLIGNAPKKIDIGRLFVSKYLVDGGLIRVNYKPLGVTSKALYRRREEATQYVSKSQKNRTQYKKYKLHIDSILGTPEEQKLKNQMIETSK